MGFKYQYDSGYCVECEYKVHREREDAVTQYLDRFHGRAVTYCPNCRRDLNDTFVLDHTMQVRE